MPCLCLVPGKHSTTSDNKICALDAAWDCIASKPAYSGSKWYRRQSSSEMSAGRPSRPMNSLKRVKSGAGSESIKCRRHPILPRCCQQKLGSPHHQTWHGLTSTQQKLRTKPTKVGRLPLKERSYQPCLVHLVGSAQEPNISAGRTHAHVLIQCHALEEKQKALTH